MIVHPQLPQQAISIKFLVIILLLVFQILVDPTHPPMNNFRNEIIKMIRMMKGQQSYKLNLTQNKNTISLIITQIRQNFIIKQTFPFSIMIQRKNSNVYQGSSYSPFKIFQTAKNSNRAKIEYTEMSPRQSLSPLKRNNLYSKTSNHSKSPIINCSKNNYNSQNRNLSPLRRQSSGISQECEIQRNTFQKLSKKYSNNSTNQRSANGFQCSTNYLQSDRFANTETNLFTKLAAKLNQSNRGCVKEVSKNNGNDFFNKKNFSQGFYSRQQDNQAFRAIPQSSRFNNSNKKSFTNLFINNVATIQSIQSPQDHGFSFSHLQNQAFCQQFQYPVETYQNQNQKYQENIKQKRLLQPNMKKKESNENNKNIQNYSQKKEDYVAGNSFGTPSLKKEIIGSIKQIKNEIRPFQQIQAMEVTYATKPTTHPQIRLLKFEDPDKQILSSQQIQQDSQFQTIRLILDKLKDNSNQNKEEVNQQVVHNVNVSLQASRDSLNMNPFL